MCGMVVVKINKNLLKLTMQYVLRIGKAGL